MANKHTKNPCAFPFAFTLVVVFFTCVLFVNGSESEYVSAVGDPGMKRDGLRLAIESWNQCNEVGEESPHMGSPRAADCFDIYTASPPAKGKLGLVLFLFFPLHLLLDETQLSNLIFFLSNTVQVHGFFFFSLFFYYIFYLLVYEKKVSFSSYFYFCNSVHLHW